MIVKLLATGTLQISRVRHSTTVTSRSRVTRPKCRALPAPMAASPISPTRKPMQSCWGSIMSAFPFIGYSRKMYFSQAFPKVTCLNGGRRKTLGFSSSWNDGMLDTTIDSSSVSPECRGTLGFSDRRLLSYSCTEGAPVTCHVRMQSSWETHCHDTIKI